MCSVSHKVIYIYSASVLWKFSCQNHIFSSIFADFERRIGASEIFEHRKNGEDTHALSKLRLT